MPDDKTQRGGQDRELVSLSDDHELRDWAKKFGVSVDVLKAAVQAVGNRASDVEAHLQSKR